MEIRRERSEDYAAVRGIVEAAFETAAEANLVDALREQASPYVSLVAEEDGVVVGHILFTPVTLDTDPGIFAMGLAPMVVIPERQRSGIGSALVTAGLAACRELGARACVVLGHPEYYPRFGFVASTQFGFRSEYDVPDEVFMAMELEAGVLAGKSGTIAYHSAFQALD